MSVDVLILVGPTASGKSAVAVELAHRLPGEIISADSMQVYRGVAILTQQPPLAWQQAIPHHLIGTRALSETWNAAVFREEVLRLMAAVRDRGRVPIVVGGTGLYVRALLDGLCEAPAAAAAVRARLSAEIAAAGSDTAHRRLAMVDPVAAGKIHPRDARRIVRALEVYEATGVPLSQRWQEQPRESFPHRYALIGLAWPRAALYARINERVRQMFADGVVEEVKAVGSHSLSHTAQQMLGFSVIQRHFAGELTLEATLTAVQQQTRQYARRQLIWFRRDARIQWIACEGLTPADIAQHIIDRSLAAPVHAG